MSKYRGSYDVISVLDNRIYKLADKKEVLKILINKDLFKLYKDYK